MFEHSPPSGLPLPRVVTSMMKSADFNLGSRTWDSANRRSAPTRSVIVACIRSDTHHRGGAVKSQASVRGIPGSMAESCLKVSESLTVTHVQHHCPRNYHERRWHVGYSALGPSLGMDACSELRHTWWLITLPGWYGRRRRRHTTSCVCISTVPSKTALEHICGLRQCNWVPGSGLARTDCQPALHSNRPGDPHTTHPRMLCPVHCACSHKHNLRQNQRRQSPRWQALCVRVSAPFMRATCRPARPFCLRALAMIVVFA